MVYHCTFKYGIESKDIQLRLSKREFSKTLLCAQAIKLFEFPEGTEPSHLSLEFRENKTLAKMDQDTLQHVSVSRPLTIVVFMQKSFSTWTFPAFSEQFKLWAEHYGDLPKFTLTPGDFPDTLSREDNELYINSTLNEILKSFKICPGLMIGNKSERSLFVFEILKQVTYLFGGKFQLSPRKLISGSLGSGPVDYAIEYKNAIVIIVKAKWEYLDEGVAQDAIQLDSAGTQSIQTITLQELTQYSPRQQEAEG